MIGETTHLEERAKELMLRYPLSERDEVAAFLTALARNYQYTGTQACF